MSKETFLFVGGELDGKRITLENPSNEMMMPIINKEDAEDIANGTWNPRYEKYQKQTITINRGYTIILFLKDGMSSGQAVKLLMDNYRPAKSTSFEDIDDD